LPEARTASDFLQLKGKPVTAEAIRNFHASAGETLKKINVRSPLKRIIQILEKLTAVVFVLLAVGILVGVSSGSAFMLSSPLKEVFPKNVTEVTLLVMVWVAVSSLAGILLVFAVKLWNVAKAIKKPLIALSVALVLSVSVGIGLSVYVVDSVSARWDQKTTRQVTLLQSQTVPQKLVINGSADATQRLTVRFVQTTGKTKLEQVSYPGMPRQNVQTSNENGIITITQQAEQKTTCGIVCRSFAHAEEVVLFAPEISDISVTQNAVVVTNNVKAESLSLNAEKSATININGGVIKTLTAGARENGTLGLTDVTVQAADIALDENSYIYVSKARSISVTAPCSDSINGPAVKFDAFPTEKLTLNGQSVSEKQAQSLHCFDMWESSLYDESNREGQV